MSRFTTRPRPACSSGHRSSSPPCKMHFPLAPTLCFRCRVLCTTLASKVFFAPGLSSHILSSLSSDSTPLKHLNPDSVQIYISSADLSSELQMHACNYLLNISNWRPDQLLKLKSALPCHLPPHFTAILSLLVVQVQNLEIILDSCFFLMSLIQGFINPVGSTFKIYPNSNH